MVRCCGRGWVFGRYGLQRNGRWLNLVLGFCAFLLCAYVGGWLSVWGVVRCCGRGWVFGRYGLQRNGRWLNLVLGFCAYILCPCVGGGGVVSYVYDVL